MDYYINTLKKQAVVNAGLKFILTDEASGNTYEFLYPNGIVDYINEISAGKNFTEVQYYETSTRGRDREDKT